ncbi:MAG: NAD(P)-binding domain-containing protein [Ardenticatenales bacterium]|nr:NAD(P)-binding domain-containing protein [Ardenticatenales bacterium]
MAPLAVRGGNCATAAVGMDDGMDNEDVGVGQTRSVDVVIIGAGESGLAAAYFAKRAGLDHVVLEAADVAGSAWLNRYDSLVLYTPRRFSALPGLAMPGRPNGYPTRDEVGAYLQQYARAMDLDVAYGEPVRRVTLAASTRTAARSASAHAGRGAPGFVVATVTGTWRARAVVVATGGCHLPIVPEFGTQLPRDVFQIHSGEYRNPGQVAGQRVLVVGAGNSGAQISVELAGAGRDVTIAVGDRMRFMPLTVLGRSIFCWGETLGYNYIGPSNPLVRWTFGTGEVIMGYALRDALRDGRIRSVGRVLGFAARHGFLAADDAGAAAAIGAFDAVVWCTGFRPDHGWLAIDGALRPDGQLRQAGGVGDVPGLYAIGLPWMRSRVSELIGGVGRDAAWVMRRVERQLGESAAAGGGGRVVAVDALR